MLQCSVSMRRLHQALDRLDPVLPLRRAAPSATDLNTTGTDPCRCMRRWTPRPAAFTADRSSPHQSGLCRFLKEVVSLCPPHQQIHIILDNLSAHKTALVREFLEQHPRVRFHFTPTYSSWLNRSNSGSRKSSGRSSPAASTSVPDLARKLRRDTTLTQPMLNLSTGRPDLTQRTRKLVRFPGPFPPRLRRQCCFAGRNNRRVLCCPLASAAGVRFAWIPDTSESHQGSWQGRCQVVLYFDSTDKRSTCSRERRRVGNLKIGFGSNAKGLRSPVRGRIQTEGGESFVERV